MAAFKHLKNTALALSLITLACAAMAHDREDERAGDRVSDRTLDGKPPVAPLPTSPSTHWKPIAWPSPWASM